MKPGELREGYIAKWTTYPQDELRVRVARPSSLAPSKKLLGSFMRQKKLRISTGLSELEARKAAWSVTQYEQCFRDEIANSSEAQSQLQYIVSLLKKGKNIRLICYEKYPPCHRFILMDIIKRIQKEGRAIKTLRKMDVNR